MGLEGINIVSLKKPMSVPRLTIWDYGSKSATTKKRRIKLGQGELARADFHGGLFGKTKEEPKTLKREEVQEKEKQT